SGGATCQIKLQVYLGFLGRSRMAANAGDSSRGLRWLRGPHQCCLRCSSYAFAPKRQVKWELARMSHAPAADWLPDASHALCEEETVRGRSRNLEQQSRGCVA